MSTILSEIEALYRSHPRADVTSALTTLLLNVLSAQQTLLDTFVILHAGFVSSLYRLVGLDFAAHVIQTLVERFDVLYEKKERECVSLAVFLCELYNFGVVGCGIVYDLIRMFLQDLEEFDTELLLKVVQSGFFLTQYLMVRFGTTITTR
jgi:nucleolar MIF4G domain-containing protein 1